MNIYARYFDQDVLAHNVDELIDFLASIPEIPVNARMIADITAYAESSLPYPKRYKIRPRVYFILIKTTAETMEEFKAHRKGNADAEETEPSDNHQERAAAPVTRKEQRMAQLSEERAGWYLSTIVFKRVLPIAATGKFCYQDTTFQAYVRATSGNDCYAKTINHLRQRQEIDPRSQFPSARGNNFTFEFVGQYLPE